MVGTRVWLTCIIFFIDVSHKSTSRFTFLDCFTHSVVPKDGAVSQDPILWISKQEGCFLVSCPWRDRQSGYALGKTSCSASSCARPSTVPSYWANLAEKYVMDMSRNEQRRAHKSSTRSVASPFIMSTIRGWLELHISYCQSYERPVSVLKTRRSVPFYMHSEHCSYYLECSGEPGQVGASCGSHVSGRQRILLLGQAGESLCHLAN